jgi:hypothetical protein
MIVRIDTSESLDLILTLDQDLNPSTRLVLLTAHAIMHAGRQIMHRSPKKFIYN